MTTLNRTSFQQLAGRHLDDARLLLREERWASAYYLAGYAVECALKACIAKRTREHDFPDKDRAREAHTHRIGELVKLAELEEKRKDRCQESKVFEAYWQLVTSWSERSRYEPRDKKVAEDLVLAIGDNKEGVLPWISQYW